MITLQSLTRLEDGRFYAKYFDSDDATGIGHTVAALHHEDGRLDAANFNTRAPRLTDEQMSQAQPDQHRAYTLAAQGTAVRPEWANRYQKAAEIVASNGVTLTSQEAAVVVSTSGTTYAVLGKSCTCKYSQMRGEVCSHYLAVRMARALNLPIGGDEAARERAHAARVQANKDAAQLRIARRGENKFERARAAQRGTAEGARRYALAAMANGGTIPADIWQRANGRGLLAGVGGD